MRTHTKSESVDIFREEKVDKFHNVKREKKGCRRDDLVRIVVHVYHNKEDVFFYF